MSSDPTTSNKLATEANSIIKTIEGILVPIVENAIISAVPALGLPMIKQITQAIEQALADKITALAETGVTFEIIDLQVGSETSDFNSALGALKAAQASGDQNAISKALSNLQSSIQALGHYDGSASPQ